MRKIVALLLLVLVVWMNASACAPTSSDCDMAIGPDGACVECAVDSDCSDGVCMPDHTCGCNQDAQCASLWVGHACVGGSCGCNTDADCTAPSFGPRCASDNSRADSKRCWE